MHDCQKFRDSILDEMPPDTVLAEMERCGPCRSFYEEAAALGRAVASAAAVPELPEEYWLAFTSRVRARIADQRPQVPFGIHLERLAFGAVAAGLIALTVFLFDATRPLPKAVPAGAQVVSEHITDLDPGTIDFLEQSELFLRSFVKIRKSDLEELHEARDRATLQLTRLDQRRAAAEDFTPVRAVLEDYETVLRDIRNLDMESGEELADIQERIGKNGIIASLKVYQPRIVLINDEN